MGIGKSVCYLSDIIRYFSNVTGCFGEYIYKILYFVMHEPLFQRIHVAENQSYNVLKVDRPNFVVPWHFHPEIELMLVIEGEGTRFVGDSIDRFGPGDLVLVGANLSHVWKNSDRHYEAGSALRAKARVILFRDDCFGEHFFKTPELQPVHALFQRAARGIHFYGKVQELVAEKIGRAYSQQGTKRLLTFLDILHDLASSPHYTMLTTLSYTQSMEAGDMARLNTVLNFLISEYRNPLRLEDVAAQANMSPTAFCRYFKSRTNKTVVGFINELRVGYAHKLLIETAGKVNDICFDCGFNNLSNFYEQFQSITGRSPAQYRKDHLKKQITSTSGSMSI